MVSTNYNGYAEFFVYNLFFGTSKIFIGQVMKYIMAICLSVCKYKVLLFPHPCNVPNSCALNMLKSTFGNSDHPDECCISSGCTLFVKINRSSDKEYVHCLFENYNLTPLDMYIGQCQVHCIKPEGRIH